MGIKRQTRVLREQSKKQGMEHMISEDSGTKAENQKILWVFSEQAFTLPGSKAWLPIRQVEEVALEGNGWPSAYAVARICFGNQIGSWTRW